MEADAMREATPTPEAPAVAFIHPLTREGLSTFGHHGPMGAMGVPRSDLPSRDALQIMVAQLARKPRMEDVPVGTESTTGPGATKPQYREIPLFVSDMSSGALSQEAKTAMAKGAERLNRFLRASVELVQVMARACEHHHLNRFRQSDLASWNRRLDDLAGVEQSRFDASR